MEIKLQSTRNSRYVAYFSVSDHFFLATVITEYSGITLYELPKMDKPLMCFLHFFAA